jgi:hypothetical protein
VRPRPSVNDILATDQRIVQIYFCGREPIPSRVVIAAKRWRALIQIKARAMRKFIL